MIVKYAFKYIAAILFWFFIVIFANAQTNDAQARQKYQQAKEAYSLGKYNYATSYLVEAKLLLGKTNIKIQPLLVKCFVKIGKWTDAKKAVKEYYALNPDKDLVEYAEIVELEKQIDKQVPNEFVTKSNLVGSNSKTTFKVYNKADVSPQFPGGENALTTFLATNMRYPIIASELEIQGTVIVRFVVQNNGCIGTVEIVQPLFEACDNEVIRLIKSMPNWKPGTVSGSPVNVWCVLPVKFKLN